MIGTIIYPTLEIEITTSYVNMVILEILVTNIVFHFIYQIPYSGLRGH